MVRIGLIILVGLAFFITPFSINASIIEHQEKIEVNLILDEVVTHTETDKSNPLPKTSTNMYNKMIVGVGMCIIGVLIFLKSKKTQKIGMDGGNKGV